MDIMNKRGQALVEFIIILPVFLMLLLGIVDIGMIISANINLESQVSEVVDLYKLGKSEEEIAKRLELNDNKIELIVVRDDEYINFSLVKKIDIITPGLNLILGNPYSLEIKRSIENAT